MNKSNPVLFEWLVSPVVYYKDDYFFNVMTQLTKEYFSPISSVYHYLHMASGNYREYLQEEQVKMKKYFYVLRPLLSCMWIESAKEPPPIEFEKLLSQITETELLNSINELLAKKKSGIEMGLEPRIDLINNFIEKKLLYFKDSVKNFDPKKKSGQALLEQGFIGILENIDVGRGKLC